MAVATLTSTQTLVMIQFLTTMEINLQFQANIVKGTDEDGIRTHAGRAHWISSPTP